MNDSKSSSGGTGTAGIEARIDRIRQTLAVQQARLARASMLTASVGAILCALLAFWFYYGYVKIKEVMTPQAIVQAAETVVIDSLPKARTALETQITDNADEWAASISKQIQENVPEIRRKLETTIVEKSSEAFDHFQVLSATQFRNFVQANQPMLNDGFRSLKKQDEADRFVQDLHRAVEEQLSTDMRTQSEEMLHTLVDLNSKLLDLAKGERINHEQALEREILMIARRLQLDSQSEQAADPSAKPVARRRARPATTTEAPADATAGSAKDQAAPSGDSKSDDAKKDSPAGGSAAKS
jgi:hypothetical protein